MQITSNTTPFLTESFLFTDKCGQKHCVVVLKATFDVDRDGNCQPGEEQIPFVYADEHYGDPGETSIRYESDFAPVKPLADVLVNAIATPPRAQAVTELMVRLDGPGFAKAALVTGDRVWKQGILSPKPSDPVPFTAIPLVWDRAFGGSDLSHKKVSRRGSEVRNLAGVGFHLNRNNDVLGTSLPNIEQPNAQMRHWLDKPEPIGFGPVGRGWQPRIGFAGTYDKAWMDERMPFLPEDFDNRYFQSAPMDQQRPRLSPGDTFRCLNMCENGIFTASLPPIDARVRFLFENSTNCLDLKADTLILEPKEKRLILLGRTSVPLQRKFTSLREIKVEKPSETGVRDKSRCKDHASLTSFQTQF